MIGNFPQYHSSSLAGFGFTLEYPKIDRIIKDSMIVQDLEIKTVQ